MADVLIYTGTVTDPEALKLDDPACVAEIKPGDVWFLCQLEPHGSGVQHQAQVFGELLKWSDSGQYWVFSQGS
jgi:hypothetical protein